MPAVPTSSRSILTIVLLVLAAASAVLLTDGPAHGQGTEVRLSGNSGNNFFIIREKGTAIEFCSDVVGCFTRARVDVQRIDVDGFDGDDGLFIEHGASLVSHPTVPISLTFVGGAGSDEVRICSTASCGAAITTDISILPDTDEIRIVQCLGTAPGGARCLDEPFQQTVPTLKVNASGVDVVTDQSRGPLSVAGTAGPDTVTVDGGEVITNRATGQMEVSGRISIDSVATLQVVNKSDMTIDTGAGPDLVVIDGAPQGGPSDPAVGRDSRGFGATQPCAADGATGEAPLCLITGDEDGDRVAIAADDAAGLLSLTPRSPGTARLDGFGAAPTAVDLTGVDTVDLTLDPVAGRALRLLGTAGPDRASVDLSTGGQVLLSATMSPDGGSAWPAPSVRVTHPGGGELPVVIDLGEGADVVGLATGSGSDDLSAGATVAGTLVRATPAGAAAVAVTTTAERIEVATGEGLDVLRTSGPIDADLRVDGGDGDDVLVHTGDGTPIGAHLETGRVGNLTRVAGDTTFLGTTTTAVERWELIATEPSVEGATVPQASAPKVAVFGTDGPDAMGVVPTGPGEATLRTDGRPTVATTRAGLLELLPGNGDDLLTIQGTTAADEIAVGRGSTTSVRIGGLLPVRADAALESVTLDGRSGDDRFIVSGSGGTATFTAIGGVHTGGDRLSFADSAESAVLTFDAVPSSGTIAADGPPVSFRDLEHVDVEGRDAGTFTVVGSDTHDVLVQDGQTVTAGRGTTAAFTRYPVLSFEGRAGDDDVVVTPHSTVGMSEIRIAGGDAGTDRAVVVGQPLRETILWTPTGTGAGTIATSLAPVVTVDGVEEVEADGRTAPPSGDLLQVSSPAIAGTVVVTPGPTTDAGSIALVDGVGAATSAPVLHFAGLGRGSVVIDGADATGAAGDMTRILGQPDADVLTLVGDGTGRTTTTVDTRVPVVTTAVVAVQLHGLEGQDTFRVPLAHGIPGGPAPAITVDAGSTSGEDLLVATATGAPVTADLDRRQVAELGARPLAFANLDRLRLVADGQATTLLTSAGPDGVVVRPTSPDTAQVTSDLLLTRLDVTGSSLLTVDTREGADGLTVLGGTTPELIQVVRGTVPRVQVGDRLPVVATDAVEAIRVDGLEGADQITVVGEGGPSSLALEGGVPSGDADLVRLVASEATVTFDDPATAGRLDSPGGGLAFAGVQQLDLAGNGSGALTVRGTDGPDTATLGDPGTPAVRVNDGAAVTYAGYPTLRLDGRGGTDATTVSYANLGDLQDIEAVGGSALDDVVRIVDTLGTVRDWTFAPVDADHGVLSATGVPTISAIGTGRVDLLGRGAGDVVTVRSPEGAQDVIVTAGATVDSATIAVGSLLPLGITDVGADGRLVTSDTSSTPQDRVVIGAGPDADTLMVTGADRTIRLTGFIPLVADGADRLVLRTGEGNDTVMATGPLPWTTTTIEGGGPDTGDAVHLDGPTGDARVDLDQGTVTGYGGTVRILEVDDLRTSHALRELAVVGTRGDDAMCIDPLTPRDARIQIIASPNGGLLTDSCQPAPGTLDVLHHVVDVGRLLVDPGIGSDQVLVNGTVADDAVVIQSTGSEVAVSVNPVPADTTSVRLPVNVRTATTENLVVATDNGVDDVDVRLFEALAPVLTLHGEAPSTRKSDHLTVRDLSGGASINNTGSAIKGSGTVTVDWTRFSGISVVVNYTGMEEVQTFKGQRPR